MNVKEFSPILQHQDGVSSPPPSMPSQTSSNWDDHRHRSGSTGSASTSSSFINLDVSFAAPRSNVDAEFLVDAHDFYQSLCNTLISAKESIMIVNWFLAPFVFLKKHPTYALENRFDQIVEKKCQEGVEIYIILWDETNIGASNWSRLAMEALSLYDNCYVIRHPPFSPLIWTHHQKSVVVDQEIAFVGGLDIVYGRYDNGHHIVTDKNATTWPGKDYYNATEGGMGDCTQPFVDSVDRRHVPRMGWHDMMVKVNGEAARDCAYNFIERWNNHREEMGLDHFPSLSLKPAEIGPVPTPINFNVSHVKQAAAHSVKEMEPSLSIQSIVKSPLASTDSAFKVSTPATPSQPVVDLLSSMIPPTVSATEEHADPLTSPPTSPPSSPPTRTVPARNDSVTSSPAMSQQHSRHVSIDHISLPHSRSQLSQLSTYSPSTPASARSRLHTFGDQTVECVRSIAPWSGSKRVECSFYRAVLNAIEAAKHYIYIENQNFVSHTGCDEVVNIVGEELIHKIDHAIKNNQTFRVIIVMPLHPDGNYEEEAGQRALMHYQYQTISRNDNSLLNQLKALHPTVDMSQYIVFCSLANWGTINGEAVQEMIHVHSKMMIVDDRIAIVGSGNINDRSFLGDRDSELAVIVEDSLQIPIRMNGQPYLASHFAFSLRMRCWREHLGLSYEDMSVMDPIVDSTYNDKWLRVADLNTQILTQVFPWMASDAHPTFEHQEEAEADPVDPQRLQHTQGHLIYFPLNYLNDQQLELALWDLEHVFLGEEFFY